MLLEFVDLFRKFGILFLTKEYGLDFFVNPVSSPNLALKRSLTVESVSETLLERNSHFHVVL